MRKKYVVTLSDTEREILIGIIKKLSGSSHKVRRAHILLKADSNGPGRSDQKTAEAFDCTTRTVEALRERLVTEGFEAALNRKKRATPPNAKALTGEQEAQLIAMRLGSPPDAYGSWTLGAVVIHKSTYL